MDTGLQVSRSETHRASADARRALRRCDDASQCEPEEPAGRAEGRLGTCAGSGGIKSGALMRLFLIRELFQKGTL